MNILFLSIGRLSSISDRGIYTDLLRKFEKEGHEIYVVSPTRQQKKAETYTYEEDRVKFLRVKSGNLKGNNIFEKGLNTLLIEPLFKNAIKKHLGHIKFDLVLYSTPPITFANVIKYVKEKDNAKTYLLLKDIFPQNAVDLEMIKENGLIHNYFRRKEKKLYSVSDYIGCMSEANVKYILAHNDEVDKAKIEINPNTIYPITSTKYLNKDLYEKYNINKNKVNFFYGGNLGKPQGIDFLLKCLKSNLENEKVHFTIVGSGTEQKKLKSFIERYQPENVTYINKVPKDEYDKLITIADVGMIFLDERFSIPNYPSRLLPYIEAGLPVLSATDKNTDIKKTICDNHFGHSCISDAVNNFNQLLPKFYKLKDRIKMGENGRRYLENNFTTDRSYKIIMEHFKEEM